MSSTIQVSVRLEPQAVPAGGSLVVVATATNVGAADTVLRFRSSCRIAVTLLNADGKTAYRPFPMCLQVLGEHRLAPGGILTERLALGAPEGDPWSVPTGRYRVRVALLAEGDGAALWVAEAPLEVTRAAGRP